MPVRYPAPTPRNQPGPGCGARSLGSHYRRTIARLILLNGPPASGKSTLAAGFVEAHPLSMNLDVDIVRSMIGRWAAFPTEAGLLARSAAIAMAGVGLQAGRDVIVPQLVARPTFITQLEDLAIDTGATFVEVALTARRADMHAWFAARSAAPSATTDVDAQTLVDTLGGVEALDRMYDGLVELVSSRPRTRAIPARSGDRAAMLHDLERALTDASRRHVGP